MAKQSSSIQEKIPPQNIEAEQSVLGALLIDKDAIIKVADMLEQADFYKETHGAIYQAMLDLFEHHEPIDILSLSGRLEDQKKLEISGGRTYLSTLANIVPTAAHIESYAKIVKHKSTLRKLLSAAQTITELGYNEEEEAVEVLDQAEQALFSVSQKHLKQNFIHIKSILVDTFNRLDELHQNKGMLRGIPTGFPDLDFKLGGLQKSDLVILAARPSVGKTTFALDIARHVAVNANVPIGIFSLEMSKEQLADRLLCAEASVGLWKMRTGKLDDDEDFTRIGEAMGKLSDAPIFIEDSGFVNVMQIRTKARRLKMEHNLG
ncbi:MAG: replicative DNA helicase, partial [Candidatus Kerfeldbacteria bacterium CG08_land_8_20_14_0_20_42_7]